MSEEEKISQTGLAEKVTSAYNEIRKKEYGELRQAFYEQHPEYLESDTVFNDDILGYIKQLQSENERLREDIINLRKTNENLQKSKLTIAEIIKRDRESDDLNEVLMIVNIYETPIGLRIIVE